MQFFLNVFIFYFCLFSANASMALVQPVSHSEALAVADSSAGKTADAVPVLEQVEQLLKDSAKLVDNAHSGKAPASQFRINVTFYREGLRELMLENRKIIDIETHIPQNMLVDMVRMSALLNSAAECKTGRFIVCPADLMTSLKSQQQLLYQQWQTIKTNVVGPD